MTDWGHIWEIGVAALSGSVPVLLQIAKNKRQARADTERRHQENQSLLQAMSTREKYFPHHKHGERGDDTALTVGGIDYPPPNGER